MYSDACCLLAAGILLVAVLIWMVARARRGCRRPDRFRGHSDGNGNEAGNDGLGAHSSGNGTGGGYDGNGDSRPCGCAGSCASNCESCAARTCPNSNNYWTDAVFNYNNFENFTSGPDPGDPYRPVIPVNKMFYPYACTSEPGGPPFIANWDPGFAPRPNGKWFPMASKEAGALALVEPGPDGADARTWHAATGDWLG